MSLRAGHARRWGWAVSALAGALIVALGAHLCRPLWGGFGPWQALPREPAPSSQTVDDLRFAETGRLALEALATHRARHGFPALTAGVSLRGELVWTGAVGWADLERRTPASRETVMRIGSTSKALTATALARLIDRGQMHLDLPLSALADDWANSAWGELTPRQLASHTAGLPEYENNGDWLGSLQTLLGTRRYSSVRESLELFDGAALLYEPGTDFAYSSFDVNLLGAAMAASQQEPFLELLERLVFEPLELPASGGASDGSTRPGLARFYELDGDRVRLWRPFDLSQRWPGGGLLSTSAELARIGGSWMDPTFISVTTREAMWTPQRLASGEVNEQSYAIGWRYSPEATWPGDEGRPLPFAHHGGVSKGAMSWLVVYPDHALSIAVNINTRAREFSEFSAVEKELAVLFLERLQELRQD